MKGATRRSVLAGIVLLGFAAAAQAADTGNTTDVTDGDRVFRNFTREAATVQPGQIRLEIRGMTFEDNNNVRLNLLGFPARDIVTSETGGIIDVLGSYGLGKSAEVGFIVPTFIESQRLRGPQAVGTNGKPAVDSNGNPIYTYTTSQNEDVGDVQLYGKFKRSVAEHCAMAGGMELSLPTGIERKSFGTGEVGVNPFVSTRYQNGRFAFGMHAGYQFYSGDVPDIFNYSVEAIVRGSDQYAFRAELSGRLFEDGGTRYNDAVVMPGIDFNLTPDFTIRPEGLANVTEEALDWGLGIGIAYVF
jgi:hypothetical protein